jgi:hypothetical protein
VTVAGHRLGRRGLALALGALGRESELGRRVGRILRRGEMMRPTHARLVMGGALMLLLGASAGLERCPQLVGFAAGAPTITQADVVNVDGPIMSQIVMHKNDMRGGVGVPHEVLTKASLVQRASERKCGPQRLKPRTTGVPYGTAKAVPLTETVAANGAGPGISDGAGMVMKTDVALRNSAGADPAGANPEPRPTRVIQWVVVTEWQVGDGVSRTSRMVMTTTPVENPAVKGQRVQSDAAPAPEQDSEEVHPYAAVPVRGGWLVFQL